MTREEAIEYLEIERIDYDLPVYKDSPIREALNMAIEALKEPERKKGKWIKHEDDGRISGTCSCCGWDALLYETDVVGMPFCPKCGAEMEEEECRNEQ